MTRIVCSDGSVVAFLMGLMIQHSALADTQHMHIHQCAARTGSPFIYERVFDRFEEYSDGRRYGTLFDTIDCVSARQPT